MAKNKRKRQENNFTAKYSPDDKGIKLSDCHQPLKPGKKKRKNDPASSSSRNNRTVCVSISTLQIKQVEDGLCAKSGDPASGTNPEPCSSAGRPSPDDADLWSYSQIASCLRDRLRDEVTVSAQVHRRVSFLLCTKSAVRARSQRVRKAIKFGVVLLDVGWVFGKDEGDPKIMKVRPVEEWSRDRGGVIDPDDHKRVSKVTVGSTSLSSYREKKDDGLNSTIDAEEGKDDQLKEWGEPQSLGCCCVCHENGTEATCPWCPNCPRNIERTDSVTKPLCLPAT